MFPATLSRDQGFIHAPAKRDRFGGQAGCVGVQFTRARERDNFAPRFQSLEVSIRAKSATPHPIEPAGTVRFNSRGPRARPDFPPRASCWIRFNSRAREDATPHPIEPLARCWFQFTRPRGARLYHEARASTYCFTTRPRATTFAPVDCDSSVSSRAREGRAQEFGGQAGCVGSFYSRAREGRDRLRRVPWRNRRWFQFTRPRGARLAPRTSRWNRGSFNSRAREGRDTRWTSP